VFCIDYESKQRTFFSHLHGSGLVHLSICIQSGGAASAAASLYSAAAVSWDPSINDEHMHLTAMLQQATTTIILTILLVRLHLL